MSYCEPPLPPILVKAVEVAAIMTLSVKYYIVHVMSYLVVVVTQLIHWQACQLVALSTLLELVDPLLEIIL